MFWNSICTVEFITYMSSPTARMFAMLTTPAGRLTASRAKSAACAAKATGSARSPKRPATQPDSRFEPTHAAPNSSSTRLVPAASSPTTSARMGAR